ncbi:hypothetical protein [Tateyamaria pelophila]|uniref:hypothetical protein n=1 Tax=Tateyamaria pelophila TaxID=328415 RepID=UPI001CBF36CF|nr:hypothetical protein [Tateyamaria pelophila]
MSSHVTLNVLDAPSERATTNIGGGTSEPEVLPAIASASGVPETCLNGFYHAAIAGWDAHFTQKRQT